MAVGIGYMILSKLAPDYSRNAGSYDIKQKTWSGLAGKHGEDETPGSWLSESLLLQIKSKPNSCPKTNS